MTCRCFTTNFRNQAPPKRVEVRGQRSPWCDVNLRSEGAGKARQRLLNKPHLSHIPTSPTLPDNGADTVFGQTQTTLTQTPILSTHPYLHPHPHPHPHPLFTHICTHAHAHTHTHTPTPTSALLCIPLCPVPWACSGW